MMTSPAQEDGASSVTGAAQARCAMNTERTDRDYRAVWRWVWCRAGLGAVGSIPTGSACERKSVSTPLRPVKVRDWSIVERRSQGVTDRRDGHLRLSTKQVTWLPGVDAPAPCHGMQVQGLPAAPQRSYAYTGAHPNTHVYACRGTSSPAMALFDRALAISQRLTAALLTRPARVRLPHVAPHRPRVTPQVARRRRARC